MQVDSVNGGLPDQVGVGWGMVIGKLIVVLDPDMHLMCFQAGEAHATGKMCSPKSRE